MPKEALKEIIEKEINSSERGIEGTDLINHPVLKPIFDKYPQHNVITLTLELIAEEKISEIRYTIRHKTKSIFFPKETEFIIKDSLKEKLEIKS